MSDLNRVSDQEWSTCLEVVQSLRVAIFVVAYNAESHIRDTLRRIPRRLLPHLASVYVFDDSSADRSRSVSVTSRAFSTSAAIAVRSIATAAWSASVPNRRLSSGVSIS